MSTGAWILLVAAGVGVTAAWVTDWWSRSSRLLEAPSPAEAEDERRFVGDRFVDLPGFPGPSAAAVPELWSAVYPPGSLGAHPESAPYPGPLSAGPGDVEDLLTGVLRLRHDARH